MPQACLTLGDPRNNPAVKNTSTLCTLLGGKYPPRNMRYTATAHAATCHGAVLGTCTSSRDGITDQTIFANDIWLLGETKLSRTTTKASRKARQRQAWLTSCRVHITSFYEVGVFESTGERRCTRTRPWPSRLLLAGGRAEDPSPKSRDPRWTARVKDSSPRA